MDVFFLRVTFRSTFFFAGDGLLRRVTEVVFLPLDAAFFVARFLTVFEANLFTAFFRATGEDSLRACFLACLRLESGLSVFLLEPETSLGPADFFFVPSVLPRAKVLVGLPRDLPLLMVLR